MLLQGRRPPFTHPGVLGGPHSSQCRLPPCTPASPRRVSLNLSNPTRKEDSLQAENLAHTQLLPSPGWGSSKATGWSHLPRRGGGARLLPDPNTQLTARWGLLGQQRCPCFSCGRAHPCPSLLLGPPWVRCRNYPWAPRLRVVSVPRGSQPGSKTSTGLVRGRVTARGGAGRGGGSFASPTSRQGALPPWNMAGPTGPGLVAVARPLDFGFWK